MAPGLLAQNRQKVFDAVNHSPEVDAHQPFDVFDRKLLRHAEQPDPGVVDEHVSAPMRIDYLARELRDTPLIRDINDVRADFIARAYNLLQHPDRFIEFPGVDVGDGDRRALLSQTDGESAAYSRSRAGHNSDRGMINLHNFDAYFKWRIENGEWVVETEARKRGATINPAHRNRRRASAMDSHPPRPHDAGLPGDRLAPRDTPDRRGLLCLMIGITLRPAAPTGLDNSI